MFDPSSSRPQTQLACSEQTRFIIHVILVIRLHIVAKFCGCCRILVRLVEVQRLLLFFWFPMTIHVMLQHQGRGLGIVGVGMIKLIGRSIQITSHRLRWCSGENLGPAPLIDVTFMIMTPNQMVLHGVERYVPQIPEGERPMLVENGARMLGEIIQQVQNLATGSPRSAVWLERPTNDETGYFVFLRQLIQSHGNSFVIVVPPGVVVRSFVVGHIGDRFYCRDTIIGRGMSGNCYAYSFVGDVQSHDGAVEGDGGEEREEGEEEGAQNA